MNFKDRSNRPQYWYWVLFVVLISIVANIIDGILGTGHMMGTNGAVSSLASLALLVPNIAVGVRRLHDIDKSGWWILAALIPIFGWIYLIYLYVQPGTPRENRFGAPTTAGAAA